MRSKGKENQAKEKEKEKKRKEKKRKRKEKKRKEKKENLMLHSATMIPEEWWREIQKNWHEKKVEEWFIAVWKNRESKKEKRDGKEIEREKKENHFGKYLEINQTRNKNLFHLNDG